MSKKLSGVLLAMSLFSVACAGQANSGKTTVASSNGTSGATTETTVNGNQVAMGDGQMSDESMLEDSFSDSEE